MYIYIHVHFIEYHYISCMDIDIDGYRRYLGTAGSLFFCGQKTLSETIGEFWWDYNKQLEKLLGKLLGTI